MIAFGTSALREVADRERFLELVRARTGIEVRVISGAEEAKLIALGVLSNERLSSGRFGLIDIGGGSTEISVCRGRQPPSIRIASSSAPRACSRRSSSEARPPFRVSASFASTFAMSSRPKPSRKVGRG